MISPKVPQSVADVAGHYDDLDAVYRDVWCEHLHHGLDADLLTPRQACESLIDKACNRLQVSAGDYICDVGCGYGATARYLAENRGLRVVGYTVSSKQFEYARRHSCDGLDFRHLDWLKNRQAIESADGLLSLECFSHVSNKQRFFDEIARVLKPHAVAVVTVWLYSDKVSTRDCNVIEKICREGRLAGMCQRCEVVDYIKRAGLHLVDDIDLSKQVEHTWKICHRRAWQKLLSNPGYWWQLLRYPSRHYVFLLTLKRIMWAYANNVMKYGMFVMEKV